MLKKLIFVIGFLIFSFTSFALTAKEIIEKVDYNMSPVSVKYDGEMIIKKKNKTITKKMKVWGRGDEISFIEFIYPPRDKGTRYLRNDENMWMYLPKASRTVKISGHMLRQSMMGSDVSYEDQTDRGKLNEDYKSTIIAEDEKTYTLELIALPNIELTYYRRVITVRKESFTFEKSLMYAKSGKLLKEFRVEEYEIINGRYFATKMRMQDKIKNKSETFIIAKNVELDVDIADSIFTLRNLESKSKK